MFYLCAVVFKCKTKQVPYTIAFQPTAPVYLRAAAMKSQMSDIENLKFKIDAKEDDVKELKKALKIRV